MRKTFISTIALGVALVGCKKDEGDNTPAGAKSAETDKASPTAASSNTDGAGGTANAAGANNGAVSAVGVEPGGIERDASEGPAAVITDASGTVEVRRVGEATFAAAQKDTKLYPGDVVRTADKSEATVTLADTSTIQIAEVSTVGIASRDGTADPGSAAAVLAGLARFSVADRSPGEGTFRVYTPAGVVVTKGTVYGIGVAASGSARIGVESGLIDVYGLADLAADPIDVRAGHSIVLDARGTAAAPAPWPNDDWGMWRDETDANVQISATVDAHAKAMAELEAQLADAYAQLNVAADRIATFEAQAAAHAEKHDRAAYEAALPEATANIDASFAVGGRLEALTWANAGHATLATDIYVRHPDELKASWPPVSARVDAAALWPKRFEITAAGYLEPLRGAYYIHHPRGRIHARAVGIVVPEFYAEVEPPPVEPAKVRATVTVPVFTPPELDYQVTAAARPVWIHTPSADWNANVRARIAPPRANVGWYVRPPNLKAKVLVGADVRGRFDSSLAVRPPEPRAKLRAKWTVPVGVKIKVGAPDLTMAAKARAEWRMNGRANVNAKVKANAPSLNVKGKIQAAVPQPGMPSISVGAPEVRGAVGVRAGAGATVRDHRRDAGASAGAAVKVKVKAPTVKVKVPPPPKVKVKGSVNVKGGFKIGG